MKKFLEYHDLYLKCNVPLLADVFEKFRTTALDVYQLDPAHYFTSPGLSFDVLLKYSVVQLELLSQKQNCCLLTLTACVIRLTPMTFTKISGSKKRNLCFLITIKILNIMTHQTKR